VHGQIVESQRSSHGIMPQNSGSESESHVGGPGDGIAVGARVGVCPHVHGHRSSFAHKALHGMRLFTNSHQSSS